MNETTVVNNAEVVRDNVTQEQLFNASDSIKRVLRGEMKPRGVHTQIDNCLNVINQYLNMNTTEDIKVLDTKVVKDVIDYLDNQLAAVLTTADIHDQIKEIINLFKKDLSNVEAKLAVF